MTVHHIYILYTYVYFRKRKRRETLIDGASRIESFWNDFDADLDMEDSPVIDSLGFSLFGNDQGGTERNEYSE